MKRIFYVDRTVQLNWTTFQPKCGTKFFKITALWVKKKERIFYYSPWCVKAIFFSYESKSYATIYPTMLYSVINIIKLWMNIWIHVRRLFKLLRKEISRHKEIIKMWNKICIKLSKVFHFFFLRLGSGSHTHIRKNA